MPVPSGIDPDRIHTRTDLITQLDLLRRRAARGTGRATVSLEQLARRSRLPRSTVHSYVSGLRLPPPDALDAIVLALGADPIESAAWAEALERLTSERLQGIGTWTPLVPRQLPAAPAGFTGRSNELAALANAARSSDEGGAARVVAVAGPGGVGKTALVLRWAHDATELYPDGQVWVDLRGFSASSPLEPVDALEQLLRAVGVGTIDLPADVDTRAAMFRSAVAGRRLLVVLDNARDSAQVRPLLPGTPTATTVITSRNTLRSLAAREGAQRVWLGPLGADDARALLGEGFHARASSGDDVLDRIAALCDGLPLALRIVRERLSPAPPDELARFAERLEGDRESLLAALDLDDGTGDSSVRGVLRWSYDALPADAAEAFRYIPLCLIPTFDVRCMAVLLDKDPEDTRRLLDQLVAASLLDVADLDHYRVHDLVAAFAAECLDVASPASDFANARARLLRYMCEVAESAVQYTDPGTVLRLPWPAHLPPLPGSHDVTGSAALAWVEKHADAACAAVIDAARRGPIEYAWLLSERAFRALRWVSDAGRFEVALEVCRQAALDADQYAPAVVTSRLLGITHARRGHLESAESAFGRAIELAERESSEVDVVDRANRAKVWLMRGELARAGHELREILTGTPAGAALLPARSALIELELQRGAISEAARWLAMQSSLVPDAVGDGLRIEVQLDYCLVDLAAGRAPEALARVVHVEQDSRATGNHELIVRAVTVKAQAALDLGDLVLAATEAQRAVSMSRAGTSREFQVDALRVSAAIACESEEWNSALPLVDDGLALARDAGLRHLECALLVLGARARQGLGAVGEARRVAMEAGVLADQHGYEPLARQVRKLGRRARNT